MLNTIYAQVKQKHQNRPFKTLTFSTDNPQQEQEQKETEQVKGNKQNKQIIFNQKGLNLLSLI